ncbi:MAG TPA: MazG-like family protein [Candidatus Limivivens merdigallinarum]|uniref:MazG-like family protein n=1 Tax=Candidatus Limivivens merdigallinarum TaxID=2840859 RepID=A0A9D0ZW01_9FIRM|nr:MazG-like family protein [Candidatus Limivivens merdigallinarum]
MEDFSMNDMLEMQRALQEKYKNKWEVISPAAGKHKLLWMISEIGEVIDIIKKNGDTKSVEDKNLREHLIEEMADVLMYYNDVLLCYGISANELKEAYRTKFEKNMKRW